MDAECSGAKFCQASGQYADFSGSRLINADFSGANMLGMNQHRIDANGAKWQGTNLKDVRKTDKDLAAAQTWQAS
jgi:uncharacterized protein YjbI with pentapeptide repeats